MLAYYKQPTLKSPEKLAMADDSPVDGDESKIVTKFLLDTCRLKQPTEYRVRAAMLCAQIMTKESDKKTAEFDAERGTASPPHHVQTDRIALLTGSADEFYIQPMLSCLGDIDIMYHNSIQLAIPAGHSPPAQLPAEFGRYVGVYEIIDSEYPGYVYLVWSYLLIENTDADKYDVLQLGRCEFESHDWHDLPSTEREIHGPASTVQLHGNKLLVDTVACIRCLSWPTQASNWPARQRNSGWPDSATVDRVVSNGCDVVEVAHRLCREDEWMSKHQFRLSFSRAEIVLLNSWMPVQQIVYHMLRVFVKTELLTDITDETGTKMMCNYHIKTLMLWSCEMKSRSWWIDDLSVVGICVVLLHTLADWLKKKECSHYFVNNCNLIDTSFSTEIIASKLMSITESWLSTWFVNKYIRKCAQLCPDRVSRMFDDVSTSDQLQNAVSAVVGRRLNRPLNNLCDAFGLARLDIPDALFDLWITCNIYVESGITCAFRIRSFSLRSCEFLISELAKIDSCLSAYFTAFTFLHVAYKTSRNGLNDELTDVLSTVLGQFVGKRRYCNQLSSVVSLSQATKFMRVVANNSPSTVQLIQTELSKAYLYRALRCKDSDSDSIYCLANVYLAVLYYATGHYQTAIDHCTMVTRSQNHSQSSSHVVQGELLPKIDDVIDTALGLSVFYQYVRTEELKQQQRQHVSVFTTELFAHYLRTRCLSVTKCHQFKQMSSTDEVQQRTRSLFYPDQLFVADVLSLKLAKMFDQKDHYKPLTEYRHKSAVTANELDTSELVQLLQQSAVEHLTTYRQLQAQKFGSVATIATNDFEALYAYKRGDYQRCLELSTLNVCRLWFCVHMPSIQTFPEFIPLFDDDIVSLTALPLLVDPECRDDVNWVDCCSISQLTLSLYLMTQCKLKLHHSLESLVQTLSYVRGAQKKLHVSKTFDQLTLKLTEHKMRIYLTSRQYSVPHNSMIFHFVQGDTVN